VHLEKADRELLKSKGISEKLFAAQIAFFSRADTAPILLKPATVGDGIVVLSPNDQQKFIELFDQQSPELDSLKFVPASGAASRMFEHLHYFSLEDKRCREFCDQLQIFAFFDALRTLFGEKLNAAIQEENWTKIIDMILGADGLDYAQSPKGMVLFHRHGGCARTAFEEHIFEGMSFCTQGKVRIHFTVGLAHQERIEGFLKNKLTVMSGGERVDLSYSIQEANTDTVAVDMNNQPFRDADGQLVFRPGGHGALINNLHKLEADLLFISNIDNVLPAPKQATVIRWRKIMAGVLLTLEQQIIIALEENDSAKRRAALRHLESKTGLALVGLSRTELESKLNRPIRVCGMVRNQGEPGGGPFWVSSAQGPSLQIIEKAQISLSAEQQGIAEEATHFNPVDMVCKTSSVRGEKFNLHEFVDEDAKFVSIKSIDGVAIKALELPGLWNGAMARWLTVFVEVPVETFNPVKTVNDLLRPMHQV
jgi:hypothetical protein